jgi:hypothetical protein
MTHRTDDRREAEDRQAEREPECECGLPLTDVHPASRHDGRLEGTCPEHGHMVAR